MGILYFGEFGKREIFPIGYFFQEERLNQDTVGADFDHSFGLIFGDGLDFRLEYIGKREEGRRVVETYRLYTREKGSENSFVREDTLIKAVLHGGKLEEFGSMEGSDRYLDFDSRDLTA